MKTRFWFLVAILTLVIGCAPGYSAGKPGQALQPPTYEESWQGYQNPETNSEQANRIWREESGR